MTDYSGTPLETDYERIKRRREIMRALAEKAMGDKSGQMVSGHYVPYGVGANIADLGKAWISRKGEKVLDTEEQGLQEQYQSGVSESMQRVMDALMGQSGAQGNPTQAGIMAATDPYLQNNPALQKILESQIGGGQQYYTYLVAKMPNMEGPQLVRLPARPGEDPSLATLNGQPIGAAQWDPNLWYGRSYGQESGSQMAKNQNEPWRAGAVEMAEKNVQLGMNPEIAAAIKQAEAEQKRGFQMGGLNELIQEADSILGGKTTPTESGIGTLYDKVAGFVGASPEGASEAQKLKAIGGALVAKMPRMEGPQSDRDTMLYREMAAEVGDSTVPVERRRAALKSVLDIWGRYGGTAIQAPQGAPAEDFMKSLDKELGITQ